MLTREQLQARRSALYSTDMAPALGLSKYRTPVQVWMEKTGLADELAADTDDEDEREETPQQGFGLIFQGPILRLYQERTGSRVKETGEDLVVTADAAPFPLASHFDALNEAGESVDAKFFDPIRRKEFGDPGSGDVPMDLLLQALVQGYCLRRERSHFAVQFGNREFAHYTVPIDADAVEEMLSQGGDFWNRYVVPGVPPPIEDARDIKALWPKDNGQTVQASPALAELHGQLLRVRSELARLKDVKLQMELAFKRELGEASALRSANGALLATYKATKDSLKFDAEKFQAEYPQLWAKYQRECAGVRRFLVKGTLS